MNDSTTILTSPIDDQLFSSFFKDDSVFLRTLRPLLHALNWHGSDHHLAQSLPHLYPNLNFPGLLKVMRFLGFEAQTFKADATYLDARFAPCLYISHDQKTVYLLKEKTQDGWLVYNPVENQEMTINISTTGRIYIFKPIEKEETHDNKINHNNWLYTSLKRFKGLFLQVFAVGCVLNLLILATPLFVMSVYDLVISTASITMLWTFFIGVMIAFTGIFVLQKIRCKLLTYIGAKLDIHIGNSIIQRILSLPARYTESGNIGGQISRIKDFDTVREFFTGQLIILLLDLPFVIIFIITIALLAGHMVWVPIASLIIFFTFIIIMRPFIRKMLIQTSNSAAEYHRFILETLTYLRTVKYSAAQTVWFNRFKELCAERTQIQYQMSYLETFITSVSDAIMILSALSILVVGVFLSLTNSITIGGMIASMILIWRILMPLKSLFITFAKLDQIKLSFNQINNLMKIQPESSFSPSFSTLDHLKGRITLSNISLRYPGQSDYALFNLSFEIPPGKMLGITGKSGSGKSTLLKALLKLYPLQSGRILIDNRNIEQIDPYELRQTIGYIPQKSSLFYGTIEQNLRLTNPTASIDEIHRVLNVVGIQNEIQQLPLGIKTQIKDHTQILSASFQQRLNIARALLKSPKILLINDASDALDTNNNHLFIQLLKQLKNKVTVILISQRPSHLKIADQIMILNQGKMIAGGPPDEMIGLILKGLKND